MKTLLALFFTVYSSVVLSSNDSITLVDAKEIRNQTLELFFDGSVNVDLNKNGIEDKIIYTYSDLPPKLIFDVIVDGEKIDIGLICDSISLARGITQKMNDLLCGSDFLLKWNGKTYKEFPNK